VALVEELVQIHIIVLIKKIVKELKEVLGQVVVE